MRNKVILILVILFLICVGLMMFIAKLGWGNVPMQSQSQFQGPIGAPYVKGPTSTPPSSTLLQECPDEWIVNKMPSVGTPTRPSEYFIVKGVRRELSEFDMTWVTKNCSVKPQVVY